MKKLKLSAAAFNKGEVLSRAQLKKVMGGLASGTPCSDHLDCGIDGMCVSGYCNNSWGGGTSCYDGNNGGCPFTMICVMYEGRLPRCI